MEVMIGKILYPEHIISYINTSHTKLDKMNLWRRGGILLVV